MESFLSPRAAARNTTAVDFVLAVMKVIAALLSGSAGLLADGADATVDTAGAVVVWVGVLVKRETLGTFVIVGMMSLAAVTIGYDSAGRLLGAAKGTLGPISDPSLVIAVEVVALLSAVALHVYQRASGRRNGSLTLISQSVDSRNHIFVSLGVIAGTAFSIEGVYFVDALVGAFIALRFALDAVGLGREATTSGEGEVDLSRYGLPLESPWRRGRLETFRDWILYSLRDEDVMKEQEIIGSLESTFGHRYFPLMTVPKEGADAFDFAQHFQDLVHPLVDDGLLVEREGGFRLTKRGRQWIDNESKVARFRRGG
ncbi:MAG TPA: cation transporter [Nitrososphaerales archaeon]|nr:cation transporter [Nitrososphaerales archaeon]